VTATDYILDTDSKQGPLLFYIFFWIV
jgi:hypothetical protein